MLTGECSFEERMELNREIRRLKRELEEAHECIDDLWAIIEAYTTGLNKEE